MNPQLLSSSGLAHQLVGQAEGHAQEALRVLPQTCPIAQTEALHELREQMRLQLQKVVALCRSLRSTLGITSADARDKSCVLLMVTEVVSLNGRLT
jgi:hypothetical protein